MKEKYSLSTRVAVETFLFTVFALAMYAALSLFSLTKLDLFDGILIGFLARLFSAMPAEVRYELCTTP